MIAVGRSRFLRLFWLKIAVVHLRDHQSSSDELVWASYPLWFWFYTGFANLDAGLKLNASLGAGVGLSAGLDAGV